MNLSHLLHRLSIIALAGSLLIPTSGFSFNYSFLVRKVRSHKTFKQAKRAPVQPLCCPNTLTFYNLSQTGPNGKQTKSIRDLTLAIHENYTSIEDGTFITINGTQNEPPRYCQVAKGVQIPTESSYITVYSGGFARESRPLQPSDTGDAFYKKLLNILIPGFQIRGLPQKGGGALFTYIEMRENLIHTPCICFDYPDKRETANFAQSLDLKHLEHVFNALPDSVKKILIGTSRGATALLKSQLTSCIKPAAMILESPFLNITETLSRLVQKTLYSIIPVPSFLIGSAFNWLYPNFKLEEDNLTLQLMQLTKNSSISDVPLLMVHLLDDTYVPNESMMFMVKALAKINPNVHFLVLHDPLKKARHGKLSLCKPFQQTVNAFYKKYNLPYDEALAHEGSKLLKQAARNAYQKDFANVVITSCTPDNQPIKSKEFDFKDK